MKLAACGHPVDVWYTTANVVCKACFEKTGFVYNRNSYADIDKHKRSVASPGERAAA